MCVLLDQVLTAQTAPVPGDPALCTLYSSSGVGYHVFIGIMSDRVLQHASGEASPTRTSIFGVARTNSRFSNRREWRQLDAGLLLVWGECKVSRMKPRSMSLTRYIKHMRMTFLEAFNSEVMTTGSIAGRGAPCGDAGSGSSSNRYGTGVSARGPYFQSDGR